MTWQQALIAYLTVAVVTFCMLGVKGKLPGQLYFRETVQEMVALKMLALAERGEDFDGHKMLRTQRVFETLLVPVKMALWPLYWGVIFSIQVWIVLVAED